MEYAFGFVINFLSFFTLDNLVSACFKCKKDNKIKIIIFIAFYFIVFIGLDSIIRSNFALKLIILLSAQFFVFIYLYNCSFISIFCIVAIGTVINASFETFFISLFLKIFHITLVEFQTSVLYFTLSAILVYSILFLLSLLFKFWFKKTFSIELISPFEWLMLSVYPLLTFVIIYLIIIKPLQTNTLTNEMYLISILLFFSSILLFCLMGKINKGNKSKLEIEVVNEKRKAEKLYNIALQESYDKQRSLSHDFNNNLMAIAYIAENEDIPTLKHYLHKLIGNVQKNKLVVNTNNIVVDAILNTKYTTAFNQGIITEYSINDLSNLPIEIDDIVTILSNALDNAITAAKKSEDKKIKVRFTHIECEVIIMVSNSVQENINIVDNNVFTTKSDILNHGYGIRNIKFAVEKYDPVFLIECKNLVFSLTILI